ncbi:MAG: hypothetical protein Q7T78_03270 [Rhodoferax sp.]|nr:hypothetical protein [Rhodoferax sp.]
MHKSFWLRSLQCLRCLLFIGAAGLACAALADSDTAATLREKYASLGEQLRQNPFQRPLVLDSVETPKRLTGDIYAIVEFPFDAVRTNLNSPDHWCDVMLLHINTKYCHPVVGTTGTVLRVNIGKKTPEDLAHVARIEFNYSVAAATPDYLDIMLNAKEGPLGTSDYRIQLQAVALPNAKTFLHLTYSYSANFVSKLAMQTYLATIGRGKVGFTVMGKEANGQPAYIAGVRGLVERNTMRYYLAINSFLEAAGAAPAAQLEQRLQSWFTATEQYPRQLHEVDQAAYLEMKRAEHVRQQTLQ